MPHQSETNEALGDAMDEGAAAFMQGQNLGDNPYPHEWRDLHEAWEKGWLYYQKFYHR